jgi:hypothetical protein
LLADGHCEANSPVKSHPAPDLPADAHCEANSPVKSHATPDLPAGDHCEVNSPVKSHLTQSPNLTATQAPSIPSPCKPTESVSQPDNPTPAPLEEAKADTQASSPAKPEKKQSKADIAVEEDGSKFKILSHNKRNDELSNWKCLACNRKIQKKSVKTHIASKTHKQHIS